MDVEAVVVVAECTQNDDDVVWGRPESERER